MLRRAAGQAQARQAHILFLFARGAPARFPPTASIRPSHCPMPMTMRDAGRLSAIGYLSWSLQEDRLFGVFEAGCSGLLLLLLLLLVLSSPAALFVHSS